MITFLKFRIYFYLGLNKSAWYNISPRQMNKANQICRSKLQPPEDKILYNIFPWVTPPSKPH